MENIKKMKNEIEKPDGRDFFGSGLTGCDSGSSSKSINSGLESPSENKSL